MNTEGLEARVISLDNRLRAIEDIEEIEKIQSVYGYYLDYSMWDELQDLFSENTESMELGTTGVFLGKAGVVKLCKVLASTRAPREPILVPSIGVLLHVIFIVQPVIDIDPDGKVAHGRFHPWECVARPVGSAWMQYWGLGMYENQFIKEDGKWSFKKLRFYLTFHAPFEEGWLGTENKFFNRHSTIKPDLPSTGYHPYPEVCAAPFHYKHPFSGT